MLFRSLLFDLCDVYDDSIKKITDTLYIGMKNKSRRFCENLRKLIVLSLIYGETDTIMVENGFLLVNDRWAHSEGESVRYG